MKMIIRALALASFVVLAGCAGLSKNIEIATGVYTTVTETTVPASVVIPAANTFNILKAGATNYGRYCIQQRMVPSICSADIRRNVIRAVRSGTKARDQMVSSVELGEPALSSIYNVMIAAVNGLKQSPAASVQFTGVTP